MNEILLKLEKHVTGDSIFYGSATATTLNAQRRNETEQFKWITILIANNF